MVHETDPRPSSWRTVLVPFGRLTGGWWRGRSAPLAWRLTLILAAGLTANIGVNLAVNQWNRHFFDALERREGPALMLLILVFGGIVLAVAGVGVIIVRTRETLQVRWREWLTARLADRWLGDKQFYRLPLAGREPVNPEYRIADDSRMATEPVVDFVIGVTHAVLTALAFVGVLWSVGGSLRFSLAGQTFVVPAYLMLAALLYGVLASALTLHVGRPLIGAVARRNEAEARLRFELTRVRENRESIAMIGGEGTERASVDRTYGRVVERWLNVVSLHARLTWITNSSGALVPVIPLFLALPKYLSGELSLGAMTQLAAAFTQVQVAIAWIVDNYKQVAQWHASAERVLDLSGAIAASEAEGDAPDPAARIGWSAKATNRIALQDLVVATREGRVLVKAAQLEIGGGDRVLLMGPSGIGKSTLLRVMTGLWPWGSGEVSVPAGLRVGFVPQDPYLPLGTLRDALLYPRGDEPIGNGLPAGLTPSPAEAPSSDERLRGLLQECGLPQLAARLDETERWDQVLSRGELQRLAFARLLLHEPDLVILDEATSGLDEVSQGRLMLALIRQLPQATIVSVGHRASLAAFHTRQLALVPAGDGAELVEHAPAPSSVLVEGSALPARATAAPNRF